MGVGKEVESRVGSLFKSSVVMKWDCSAQKHELVRLFVCCEGKKRRR
jgi:hypothetical protein